VSGDGFFGACAYFLSIFFRLNLILGIFNLLPVPPLDGHSVLGLFLPESTFLKFLEVVRTPTFSLLGILVAYNAFPYFLMPVLQWSIVTFYRVAMAL
jgi:Zn-dependent protease